MENNINIKKYYEVLEKNGIKDIKTISEDGRFKLEPWFDGAGDYKYVQGRVYNDSVLMYVQATEFVGFTGMGGGEPYSPICYLEGKNVDGKDIRIPLRDEVSSEKLDSYYQLLCLYEKIQPLMGNIQADKVKITLSEKEKTM